MLGRIVLRLFLFILISATLVGALAYWQYQQTLNTPITQQKNSAPLENILSVKRGDTLRHITERLQQHGQISNQWPILLYAKLNHLAPKIQAGDYSLDPQITPLALLEKMTQGDVIVNTLTIIEGHTFAQMLETINAHPYIQHTLIQEQNPTQAIANSLNIDGALEGWFLPDTYHFSINDRDIDLLKRMHTAMQTALKDAWQHKADNLPLNTPYDALILASLIEKETALASERTQIAGVFIRRLKKNMRLQTDPSVIYGAKDYTGSLTKTQLTTDTPYNTYTRHGLPPTPIALPSKASLHAALHPDDSDSLYFVANGEGGHTFSRTYKEHQKAVAHYRQQQRTQP